MIDAVNEAPCQPSNHPVDRVSSQSNHPVDRVSSQSNRPVKLNDPVKQINSIESIDITSLTITDTTPVVITHDTVTTPSQMSQSNRTALSQMSQSQASPVLETYDVHDDVQQNDTTKAFVVPQIDDGIITSAVVVQEEEQEEVKGLKLAYHHQQ